MSRVVLLLLALAVVGVAFFLWLGGAQRGGPTLAAEEAPAKEAERTAVELQAPEVLVVEEVSSTAAGSSQRTHAIDDRPRIAGHVRPIGGFPRGATARITAEVYAGPVNRGPSAHLDAKVAADGSFELRVPAATRYVMLDLESNLLYQTEQVKALPGEEGVLLVPDTLATIHGRVLLPPGAAPESAAGVKISCTRSSVPALQPGEGEAIRYVDPEAETYKVVSESDGTFEFIFMPTGVPYLLEADNPIGPHASASVAPLLPGEQRQVDIALESGITLAGLVIDEYGAPASGLDVYARARGESEDHGRPETDQTDDEGRFELGPLERRSWTLVTDGEGVAHHAELDVDGAAGDVRDLVLRIVRGACISGSVSWPDGSPVEDFFVVASGESWAGDGFEAGTFELCGIAQGDYELEVTAERQGMRGKAQVAGVRAGDHGLRIVLVAESLFTVRGTVVDAALAPVSFEVWPQGAIEAGSFTLELEAGEHDVRVSARGMCTEVQRVAVGASTPELHFVLRAAGRVRGRVLDPDGRPVANARIECSEAFSPGTSMTSGEDGRFDVPAQVSPLFLQAQRAGYAASERVEVAAGPGEVVDGVTLRLRQACRLEGRVLDADGRPLVGVAVVAFAQSAFEHTQTDDNGAFAFDGLPTGRMNVSASLEGGERAGAAVVLAGGHPTSLELRFERPDPVRIRGRVLRGGKPLHCPLYFLSAGAQGDATSGADGRFETTFQRPGTWKCAVWAVDSEFHEPRLEDIRVLDVVVPDVEQHELELEFDAMRVIESFEELGYLGY